MTPSETRILSCLEMSEIDQAVLDKTRELAQALGAKVTLLHVAQPDPDFVGFEPGPQSVRDVWAKKFHREHQDLQQAAETLNGEGIETDSLVVQGATPETICKHAGKLDVDLICLGSRGHGRLHDLILGSVAADVVRRAHRPVLLVPPRQ